MESESIEWARSEAQRFLEPLGRRWAHVQAVAAVAQSVARTAALNCQTLVAAAWLHDIGYANELHSSGFHPLDGARFLSRQGVPVRVVGLVAHHSCAIVEARLRGLENELLAFPDEGGATRDALWYCDLTTSPDGKPVCVRDRLEEIQERYGPGNVVTRFVDEARDQLLGAVERTEARLARAVG